MSSALSGSLALQHVKFSNVLEIRNGIIFDFYPGLPHIDCHIYKSVLSENGAYLHVAQISH